MATVNRFNIGTLTLPAGEQRGLVWNNTPIDVVVVVDCVPFNFVRPRPPIVVELVTTWNESHQRPLGQLSERKFGMTFRNVGTIQCNAQIWLSFIAGQ